MAVEAIELLIEMVAGVLQRQCDTQLGQQAGPQTDGLVVAGAVGQTGNLDAQGCEQLTRRCRLRRQHGIDRIGLVVARLAIEHQVQFAMDAERRGLIALPGVRRQQPDPQRQESLRGDQ